EPKVVAEPTPVTIAPQRRKPMLVSSSPAPPLGSVPKLVAEFLERAADEHVETEEVYRAYAARCRALGKRAVTPNDFIGPLMTFCGERRIESEQKKSRVDLIGVRLANDRGADAKLAAGERPAL